MENPNGNEPTPPTPWVLDLHRTGLNEFRLYICRPDNSKQNVMAAQVDVVFFAPDVVPVIGAIVQNVANQVLASSQQIAGQTQQPKLIHASEGMLGHLPPMRRN